jgi:hypothetical protein
LRLVLLAAAAFLCLAAGHWPQPQSAAPSAASSKPARTPNARRFSDRGLHPATGRAGSATLAVRALLSQNGTTDIEMTTGVLDLTDPPPPGRIVNAQLKPLNEEGHALYARNYNALAGGGYFATQVNDLHHLQQVQVQANIRSIDGNRTNVVTVVETIKKRPDLAVSNLEPGAGRVGVPLVISAVVAEQNGDVGAVTNCVLYEDGTEIDRANGIFVDAGTVVSVAFTHTFTSPGTKQIEVRLEQIHPGDWNAANNTVARGIEITPVNDTLNYTASLDDQQLTFSTSTTHKQGSNDPADTWLDSSGNTNSIQQAFQDVRLDGQAFHHSSFPYTVAVSESSNPTCDAPCTTSFSKTLTVPDDGLPFVFDLAGILHFEQHNGFAGDTAEGINVFMSNVLFTVGGSSVSESTNVQYTRFAGAVTYLSSSFARYWYLDNGEQVDVYHYMSNSSSTEANGTRIAVGTQYTISLTVTDGSDNTETTETNEAKVFTATPVIAVQTNSGSFTSPPVCNGGSFGYFFNSDCEESTFSFTFRSGSASFSGAP